jgi:nucleoside-diphosphate-sugar epimerase
MKVLVTGGSGRAGEYIMAELEAHGHTCVNGDVSPPKPGTHDSGALFQRVNFTDYGQTIAVMKGIDAVVHMAAIPAPNMDAEHVVFRVNMLSNWNVLEAAELYGIDKIVMASSINAVGAGWGADLFVPEYFPVDEAHPTRVQDAYSQSKWLGEQMADAFCRRRPNLQVASMRFHALWNPETAEQHMKQGDKQTTAGRIAMGFWSWVGRHDAARACRLALEKEFGGHEAFFINASDTVLELPTEEVISREYGEVFYRRPLPDFTSPLDISKAARLLDWEPVESWREGTVREPENASYQRPEYEAPWTR